MDKKSCPDRNGGTDRIDGKRIRSTASEYSNEYRNLVSPVSLFCRRREQILPAGKIENGKSNESDSVTRLPDISDLKGVVPTLDALHCKKTLNKTISKGNRYAVGVKGNQPNLKKALEETVITTEQISFHREKATVGGRR
jgi:hypothetical protein